MDGEDTAAERAAPTKTGRDRLKLVQVVHRAEVGRVLGRCVRCTAAEEEVPASTTYRWLAQKEAIDAPAVERDFF